MSYFLFLADDAALNLSWGAIAGIITTLLATAGGGLKILWSYWTKREDEKRAAWKKVVDDKDVLIALKDGEVKALSVKLSTKSDEHAEKIQELMGLTLTKVEEWSEKQGTLLDRALTVQAEFTSEIRRMNIDAGE